MMCASSPRSHCIGPSSSSIDFSSQAIKIAIPIVGGKLDAQRYRWFCWLPESSLTVPIPKMVNVYSKQPVVLGDGEFDLFSHPWSISRVFACQHDRDTRSSQVPKDHLTNGPYALLLRFLVFRSAEETSHIYSGNHIAIPDLFRSPNVATVVKAEKDSRFHTKLPSKS
jgi:hypothetical protein